MRLTTQPANPRSVASALGLGTLAFGALPAILPRQFARLFGFPTLDDTVASAFRAVGVRDAVMGMGLWSASAHGGNYAPWVLARLLTDAGDTLAIALTVATNPRVRRNARFVALGAVALGATLADGALFWRARQTDAARGPTSEVASASA